MSPPPGGKILNGAIWLLAAALLVENVVLLRQNHKLKTTPPQADVFAVHSDRPLRNISGVGLDGQFHVVPLPTSSAQHLLLFTFAPTCPECQLEEPFVAPVSSRAKKLGWRTVWISSGGIEDTRAYCEANNIPVQETLVEPPFSTYLRLGLGAVPQLVAVGDQGKVEGVWAGRLTEETTTAVSRFLTEHSTGASSSVVAPAVPAGSAQAQALRQ